jgi:uncharacterized protein YkwD
MMKRIGLFTTIAALLVSAAPAWADISTREATTAARMVSAWRASHGLNTVRVDDALNRAAATQTQAMMAQGVMSHDAGGDFRARMRAHGVRASSAENIAMGQPSVENVMSVWQGSWGHNANLLNPDMVRVGLAKGVTPAGQIYWTLVLSAR